MTVNLFDVNFYRAVNPDLAGFNDAAALAHFQSFGLNEGRTFSPIVDLDFYNLLNPDLATAGLSSNQQLFAHLSNFGVAEGRRFSPIVDLNFYRISNGDLSGLNSEQLFEHLQTFGLNEGRTFSQFFDLNFYRANNPDLVNLSNAQLLGHLQIFGLNEGRTFSQFFEPDFYRANNPDLANFNNAQLLDHFVLFGLSEGRDFAESFDVNYYRRVNPDLQAASLSNQQLYEHFQIFGLDEGRLAAAEFNVQVYRANNPDLANLTNQQAYDHFLIFGRNEGRPGSDYAGEVIEAAREVAIAPNPVTFLDFVGSSGSDLADFYRFTVTEQSEVRLLLNNFTGDIDVEILRDLRPGGGSIESIAVSDNSGTTPEDISIILSPDAYFVRVVPFLATTETNYNLTLSATPFPNPVDNAGNTLATARNIGVLTDEVLFNDFVGQNDLDDFYRFSLSVTSNISVLLNNLSADADVSLLQDSNSNNQIDNGEVIAFPGLGGADEEFFEATLIPGTYFIQVDSFNNANTNYTLTLSANPSPTA